MARGRPASDQLELFAGTDYLWWKRRWPCPVCDENPLELAGYVGRADDAPAGPDPCLGWLRDVVSACCGHGGHGQPYAMMVAAGEKTVLEDEDALRYFRSLGVGPPVTA